MSRPTGALLLLPTLIGDAPPERVLPAETLALARATRVFLAEKAKSARAFLKAIAHPQPIASLSVTEIGHEPDRRRFDQWLQPAIEGHDVALLSEAGCPAVAELERASRGEETQLFIETPYRNERLLQALLEHCRADTRLAIAVDLTSDAERVVSLPISDWRSLAVEARPTLARRPAVFALMAAAQPWLPSPRGRTPASGRQ